MTQIKSVSGSVSTRPFSELDSDRYEFLTLDQAEPNPGLPESDGSLFISDVDGTRKFTTKPDLSGLQFKSLPQNTDPQYVLTLNGDPNITGYDSVRWSFFPTLDNDTLFTVTQPSRGVGYDSTPTAITVWGLTTTTDALIGRDLTVQGNLQVEGDQTILNTQILTVEDRNIVVAQDAVIPSQWDSSGIIVYGAGVELLYHTGTDRWDFNRGITVTNASIFEDAVLVTGDLTENSNLIFNNGATQTIQKSAGSLQIQNDQVVFVDALNTGITASITPATTTINTTLDVNDSADFTGGRFSARSDFNANVYLTDVPEKVANTRILFRRQTDGLVMEGDVDLAALAQTDTIELAPTDSDAIFYPIFSIANGGVAGRDSAEFDLDLTYRPDVNRLELVSISASGISNFDSTFVEGDFQLSSDETGNGGRLLDSEGRSFVVYDENGALLWGNNGVSAGNLGQPQLGGPTAAQLYLNDLVDVQLNSLVPGQVIKYDGVNWVNAPDQTGGGGGGGGIALSDLAAVTLSPSGNVGNLVYSDITGAFTYTPPFVPDRLNELGDVNANPSDGQVLKWSNANQQWEAADDVFGSGGGSGDPNQNAYSFISDGSNTEAATNTTDQINFTGSGGISVTVGATNQVTIDGSGVGGTGTAIAVTDESTQLTAGVTSFTFTGTGVTATNAGNDVTVTIPGASGTLPTRDAGIVKSITNMANNATVDTSVAMYSSYALFKVKATASCWIRMYTDTASRTADASRTIEQDPAPDAGVVAEFIATGPFPQTIKVSPGVIGWCDTGQDVPLKVTNLSGSIQNPLTLTFTVLQLES